MPIRTRVQRLWRLVVAWWRIPGHPDPQQPAHEPRPAPTRQPQRPAISRHSATPAAPNIGEPLVSGVVTLRMWVVAGRVVLATSHAEAERAVVTLSGELPAEACGEARALLDALRGELAAAA
jgi:hypothetical protein